MKIEELTRWLEETYPSAAAEEWDNVGLLVGDDTKQVTHVLLALDLTEEVLEEAKEKGADMIITHHPMIFSGIKRINNHSFTGRRILQLIQMGISYYAIHTNYDVLRMGDLSAGYLFLSEPQVLAQVSQEEGRDQGLGRVGNLTRPMSLKEYAHLVKQSLGLSDVRVYGDPGQIVKRAAVCTGSGKSLLPQVLASGAQVYVTGDIDHHTGIDAVAQGLAIIDAGHYGTEYIFMEDMKEKLSEAFPSLKLSCARIKYPYTRV